MDMCHARKTKTGSLVEYQFKQVKYNTTCHRKLSEREFHGTESTSRLRESEFIIGPPGAALWWKTFYRKIFQSTTYSCEIGARPTLVRFTARLFCCKIDDTFIHLMPSGDFDSHVDVD